ncbi:MAG TPA: glucose-1-phosphate cytidylyltransferase [Terriglobales bacterium]|nr:glucose-1-phosphate cytidylyltransferase [Terriglobales bacterium]
MKVVILAGGFGTRLAEETTARPKPMVEIGGYPILWHIMQGYAHYGFCQFTLALGYKGEIVKDYFLRYHSVNSDVTVNLCSGAVHYHNNPSLNWAVQMVDTGVDTLTGGRLRRLDPHLRDDGTFMLTYGDGVADLNPCELLAFHKLHGKLATITAVRPPARFGTMVFNGDEVIEFQEKPQTREGWINGGFFVFEPGVFDYIDGDHTVLEAEPLERLAEDGELVAFRHNGFWQCMDTLRDKNRLEALWNSGDAPWKVWS